MNIRILDYIIDRKAENPGISIRKLQKEIKEKFNMHIGKSTIANYLKNKNARIMKEEAANFNIEDEVFKNLIERKRNEKIALTKKIKAMFIMLANETLKRLDVGEASEYSLASLINMITRFYPVVQDFITLDIEDEKQAYNLYELQEKEEELLEMLVALEKKIKREGSK